MQTWELIILIIAPLIGGGVALYIEPGKHGLFKLALSFSGAFLFAISVMHFFPVIFSSGKSYMGAFVLLGFFLQLLLEQLTKGVEHGHFHEHDDEHSPSFFYSVMIGISIHAFFDGVPVFSDEHFHNSHAMLWAISAHKIPEGFALATLLIMIKARRNLAIILLLLFSLTAPAGTLFADYLSRINTEYIQILFAIVGGLMLHVSTTILFESETGMHHFSRRKIIAVVAGALLALVTS
jgi:zinc and cadmium transporter